MPTTQWSPTRRTVATASTVIVMALLAGCGSSTPSARPSGHLVTPRIHLIGGPQPRSSAGHPPTTRPAGWSSDGPCPRSSIRQLPHGSGCASQAVGDFDGNGGPDRFIVYAHPLDADGMAQGWHVLLLLDDGQVRARDLDMWRAQGNKGVVTALDANRDGRAEALVILHEGASDDFTRLFALWDTRIVQVRGPDHRPFEIDTGGSVMQGAGGGCRVISHQPRFYTSSYYREADRWHWTRTFYSWGGLGDLHLTQVRREHGLTTERGAYRYGEFTCYSLHLGSSTRPKVVY
jgi:hypothetical protein